MKDNNEVIKEFNELVNMTASELEKWLKSDDSNSAGWPKETEDGETIGHDSGRKIVEILKENPEKDEEKYTEEHIAHMRKVVSYCKRHLAQETAGNKEKSEEEVKKTKSYASLKNWGHDFLKAQGKGGQEKEENKKADASKDESKEEQEEQSDEKTGDKRKTSSGQSGPNKKRETQKGKAGDDEEEEEEVEDDEMKEDEEEEISEEDEDEDDDDGDKRKTRGSKASNGHATRSTDKSTNGQSKKDDSKDDSKDDEGQNGATPKKGPKKGDTVSWNWGGGQPEGKVLDVNAEETTITTKKGNKVSRKGDEEDPAVVLDAGSSKAIKKSHELNEA